MRAGLKVGGRLQGCQWLASAGLSGRGVCKVARRRLVQGCRRRLGRSAQPLIGAKVGELEIPAWMPISWRPEHFKDSLGADERNDQVVLGGRDESSRTPVGDEAFRHRSVQIIFDVTEWPDTACQVPYQPVDVGLFPIKKGCDSSVMNQHIPGKDVVMGNSSYNRAAAIYLGDQPDRLRTGAGEEGEPGLEVRRHIAHRRYRQFPDSLMTRPYRNVDLDGV